MINTYSITWSWMQGMHQETATTPWYTVGNADEALHEFIRSRGKPVLSATIKDKQGVVVCRWPVPIWKPDTWRLEKAMKQRADYYRSYLKPRTEAQPSAD